MLVVESILGMFAQFDHGMVGVTWGVFFSSLEHFVFVRGGVADRVHVYIPGEFGLKSRKGEEDKNGCDYEFFCATGFASPLRPGGFKCALTI